MMLLLHITRLTKSLLGRPIAKHFAIFAVFQIFAICGFFEGPQKSQKPQVVRSQIFGNFPQTMHRFDEKNGDTKTQIGFQLY